MRAFCSKPIREGSKKIPCHVLIIVAISIAISVQAIPQKYAASSVRKETAARKIPCKTDANASMCYWTRGRITCCNGNPAMRMWKVGTKRILRIHSGPGADRIDPLDNEHPELPANLQKAYEADYRHRVQSKGDLGSTDIVYGEFEVCPFEPEHPGWMQAVCVESAKNIVIGKD